MTYNDISKLLGVGLNTIVNINRGSYAGSPIENYPIRRVRISEDIKAAIRE